MKLIKKISLLLLTISALAFIFWVGSSIEVNRQLKVVDILLDTASIVFTVVGIWLAIVFPEVITDIYKKKSSTDQKELIEKAKLLLTPLVLTVLIVISVFIVKFLEVVFDTYSIGNNSEIVRGSLFLYVTISLGLLIYSLILAIKPGLIKYFGAKENFYLKSRRDRAMDNKSHKRK